MHIFLIWFLFSVMALCAGIYLLKTTKRRWTAFIAVYLISQVFSWTLLWGASSGGGFILPAPDIFAIAALLSGQFFSGNYAGTGCIPPPFVGTVVAYVIVFFISQRFRRDLFREPSFITSDTPPPEKW